MVTMMIYGARRREAEDFGRLAKDLFAYLSEEELRLHCFCALDEVKKFLSEGTLLDFACIGVTGREEIALLHQIRRLYAQAQLLLVADAAVSPMEYLTPAVRAASLLLYPYKEQQKQQVLRAFLKSCLMDREQGAAMEKDFLVIENREGRTAIPFRQIYYIEVRERKIFIRIRNQEYSKYDSMEHMLLQLPGVFVRCHRSFAFNTQHLDKIRLSENTVYLEHGITIPLSRSYKSAVKEYLYGRSDGHSHNGKLL